MAPQQNSTLIDDNLDGCLSMLNLPEELNRYSPILAPNANEIHKPNQDSNKNNNNNKNYTNITANKRLAKAANRENRQHKAKHYRSMSSRGGRSISLYGVNSTTEQGHKEIPIWIADEPRYVSGVTNKTTCNDIIKALIDDEIRNGNYAYCRRTKDGAASRDYSDYVLTESWRGVERSYDGNMAILPVWKAWSRVHNELRLTLKHKKDIREPDNLTPHKKGFSTLRKIFRNFFKLSTKSNKQHNPVGTAKHVPDKASASAGREKIADELLLVLMPEKLDQFDQIQLQKISNKPSNKNLKPTNEESTKQANAKLLKEKLYRLSETRSSIRKRRSTIKRKADHRRKVLDSNNCIRRRKDAPMRSSIRNKLTQKTAEMNKLYEREYALTRELTNKCRLYKMQNDLYTNPEKNLELSIGAIQSNIEQYANDIIATEHELLDLKNEIRQDISIINDLKRMTLAGNANDGIPPSGVKCLLPQKATTQVAQTHLLEEQMQFVDNIYEFCDNNASMLV